MAAGTLQTIGYSQIRNFGGDSYADTDSWFYYMWTACKAWMHELQSSLELDQSTITPVTGLTPGTYENRWLLPKSLTTAYSTITECITGPIIATVVVASDGSVESITPTVKNGGYFAGETLRLMSDYIPEGESASMGTPSEGVDIVVATGSDTSLNIAGSKAWGFASASWTTRNTSIVMSNGRQNVNGDALYIDWVFCNSSTANGSTTWYYYKKYTWSGWSNTNGRSTPQGSEAGYSFSLLAPTGSDIYVMNIYSNPTPGSEVFFMGCSYYKSVGGFYAIDTSAGHIGEKSYSKYGGLANTGATVTPFQASQSDSTFGYDNLTMNSGVTKAGYFKPFRNAESDNFMVGGGNENMLSCSSSTPFLSTYTTSDGLVTFKKAGTYLAVRV